MADNFMVRFELDVSQAISSANRLSKSLGQVVYALGQTDTASKGVEKNLGSVNAGAAKAESSTRKLGQSLSTTRYALYDVSNTLGIVGAALIALPIAIASVGIAWERDFANVIRTSSPDIRNNATAIEELRDSFVELAQELPVSFKMLSEIGTLGGQLGIDSSGMAEFVEVVAKLGATTDLSVDRAATALGRFKALLGVPEEDFEALASAILKVGVNSVATESQIVNIATQISSMGAFAGLTAQDVVGLSGALASVGAAPEISRGALTRLFTLISRAVSESGEDLEKFAKISGLSSDQFESTWGTAAFGDTFLKFMSGIKDSGGDAVAVLNDLGITSVRDVPLFLRLANAAGQAGKAGELLGDSFRDARTGMSENSEVTEQFGIIANTTASRLTVLQNNFQAFLATIGEGASGPINVIVNGLITLLDVLTDLAKNPAAQWAFAAIGALTTLVGVLALVGAVAARGVASLITLQQGLAGVAASSGVATISYSGLLTQLALTGPLGAKAATALRLLAGAAKLLAAATVILILPDLTKWIGDIPQAVKGTNNLQGAIATITTDIDRFNSYIDGYNGWNAFERGLIGAAGSFDEYSNALITLDEETAKLVNSGNIDDAVSQLSGLMLVSGKTFDEILIAMPDTKAALESVASGAGVTTAAIQDAAEAEAELAEKSMAAADALGLTDEAFANFTKSFQSGISAFGGFGEALDTARTATEEWAKAEQLAQTGSEEGWEGLASSVGLNLTAVGDALDAQLAAQSAWADNIGIIAARGGGALAAELAKLGPAGAEAAAALATAGDAEFARFEQRAQAAAFYASDQFAAQFTQNTPNLVAAYAAGGDLAVQGMIAAQIEEARTGVPGAVAAFVNTWNSTYGNKPINMPVDADTTPATNSLQSVYNIWSGRRLTMYADVRGGSVQIAGVNGQGGNTFATGGAVQKRAYGGYISGPGGPTTDSIPAYLSDGEFVIRAAAVRKYGTGMFDALNRGVAKFAGGGQATREVISHASPTDRALMRNSGGGTRVIQIVVDGKVLAEATDSANADNQFNGSN